MKILAGDIGGTNSRLAGVDVGTGGIRVDAQADYRSCDFESISDVVCEFLRSTGFGCEVVCLGLPGPVSAESDVQLTNLPWRVNRDSLRRASGVNDIRLVNDVQASAAGIHHLEDDDWLCLHEGEADPVGFRAVISVGTGLGVAGLTPDGHPFATEAGHATFSPRDEFDFELMQSCSRELGHVSWERVASGPGLPRIHRQLVGCGGPELDPPEIVHRAGSDAVCAQVVGRFISYLGAVAGNIALTMLATGGVYFCGGVSPKVIRSADRATLVESFLDKGRMRKVLERIPVFLVCDDRLALKGAAHLALHDEKLRR